VAVEAVVDYIEAHISEAISLADLAAAGLSERILQLSSVLRPAAGLMTSFFCKNRGRQTAPPPDLARTAGHRTDRGFQTQAHFSTVFKRFVGETPAAGGAHSSLSAQRQEAPEAVRPPDRTSNTSGRFWLIRSDSISHVPHWRSLHAHELAERLQLAPVIVENLHMSQGVKSADMATPSCRS